MKRVFTAGTFDLFHIGHVNLLREAKKLGDYLIVAVSSDKVNIQKKNKHTVFSLADRKAILESCRYVDEVVIEEKLSDPEQVKLLNIDVFACGGDWKDKKYEAVEWAKKEGIKVVYLNYTKDISTTKIKKDLENGTKRD